MIVNTQNIFRPKKKTFKWLGMLFVAFIFLVLVEIVLIACHYRYQGFVAFVIVWMIPVQLFGMVKYLAYKISPDPVVYITDHDITIGKRQIPWNTISEIKLCTEDNAELLLILEKGHEDDLEMMMILCQETFDSVSWQRLKQYVGKYHKITKIGNLKQFIENKIANMKAI